MVAIGLRGIESMLPRGTLMMGSIHTILRARVSGMLRCICLIYPTHKRGC